MKHFTWVLLLLTLAFSYGCGSNPAPAPSTPEAQAEIDANDASVDAGEKAQGGGAEEKKAP